METLKLEENDEIKATLVANYFPNARLGFFAIVQTEPSNKVNTITLNHYQMRVLRDWINHSLGDLRREKLLKDLRSMTGGEDEHMQADDLLLDYIDDHEIKEAYETLERWYA